MTKRNATILLLSGNADIIQRHVRTMTNADELRVIPVEEKSIVSVRTVSGLLRQERGPEAICFACKDLELQRYQFVLKLYLLTAPARQRFLLDESGGTRRVALAGYLLKDVPMFLLEILASLVVLLRSFLKLVFLHQATRGRRTP
jgi:hypothetical protein